MATKPAFRHWTYADIAELPWDGNRYEIAAGELIVTPSSPGRAHQRLVGRLILLLQPFVEAHGLGEVMLSPFDVVLAPDDYLIPDLVFVRSDRSEIITDRAVEGAPDMVVEVLSRSSAFRDRGVKRERYALHGVGEYWLLDPHGRRLEIFQLADDPVRPVVLASGTLRWRPVPGGPTLEIDVTELFRDLD